MQVVVCQVDWLPRVDQNTCITAATTLHLDCILQQIKVVELGDYRQASVIYGSRGGGFTSSLYCMTVRLSLEVSTQVTKSSMCLGTNQRKDEITKQGKVCRPGDEKGRIGDGVWADADVALLDEFCSLDR